MSVANETRNNSDKKFEEDGAIDLELYNNKETKYKMVHLLKEPNGETENHSIVEAIRRNNINPDGTVKAIWEVINERAVITSIATTDEFVFAADAGNKIVYQYDLNGQLIKEIGKKDTLTGAPGFIIPSPYFDLLIGTQGKLWVVNPGRHAFENYDFDGNLISSWDRTSMQLEGFCGCCNPSNIALLSDGSYVTSEKGLERIKIHSPNGDFKTVVAGPESFEEGTKGLDLAVDSKDRIYVLDPIKKLIRIFEKK